MTYTTTEAATLLGIKPGSVRALIARNLLTATHHGRDWLITQAELDRYLSVRRPAHRPTPPDTPAPQRQG